MTVNFNNCRCRDHATLYGKGAFYDLNIMGLQATMATDLPPGEECVVASYDDYGRVVFDWFTFSKETLEPDPDNPQTQVRVFYGKPIRSERFTKRKAAKTKPYSVFFNSRGDFKRPSVVK